MPLEVFVPRLGWSMERGTFGGWRKNEGDLVQPGDPLFVVEADKAAFEVESMDRGRLHIPADSPQIGDEVQVGQVIALLLLPGESAPRLPAGNGAREMPYSAARPEPLPELVPYPPQPVVSQPAAAEPRSIPAELGGLGATGFASELPQIRTPKVEPPTFGTVPVWPPLDTAFPEVPAQRRAEPTSAEPLPAQQIPTSLPPWPEPAALDVPRATSVPCQEGPPAGPAARRKARELGISLGSVVLPQGEERITVEAVQAAAEERPQSWLPTAAASNPPGQSQKQRITPRARRAAKRLGVPLEGLLGTGRSGRIRERDVLQLAGQRLSATLPAQSSGMPIGLPQSGAVCEDRPKVPLVAPAQMAAQTPIVPVSLGPAAAETPMQLPPAQPLDSLRRTIAERMLAGTQQTAPVTLFTKADAENLASLRQQFKVLAGDTGELVPSLTALVAKIVGSVLGRHPLLLNQWHPQGIVPAAGIHMAVAVDTPRGLLAPVIRNLPELTIRQVARELEQLIAAARASRLTPDQMQGGTFTLTNLGMWDVDHFTPILNLPQAAILGMGRVIEEPAVWQGAVVPRRTVSLSLTFDHRVVDGGPAARFLQSVKQALENPGPGLMG